MRLFTLGLVALTIFSSAADGLQSSVTDFAWRSLPIGQCDNGVQNFERICVNLVDNERSAAKHCDDAADPDAAATPSSPSRSVSSSLLLANDDQRKRESVVSTLDSEDQPQYFTRACRAAEAAAPLKENGETSESPLINLSSPLSRSPSLSNHGEHEGEEDAIVGHDADVVNAVAAKAMDGDGEGEGEDPKVTESTSIGTPSETTPPAYCGLTRLSSLSTSLGPLYPNENTGVRRVQTLSAAAAAAAPAGGHSPLLLSAAPPRVVSSWGYQRGAELYERKAELTTAAADTETIENTEPQREGAVVQDTVASRAAAVAPAPSVDYAAQFNFFAVTTEASVALSATVADGLDPRLVTISFADGDTAAHVSSSTASLRSSSPARTVTSSALALARGLNTHHLHVDVQGCERVSYRVVVLRRQADVISSISASRGVLTPPFSPNERDYILAVPFKHSLKLNVASKVGVTVFDGTTEFHQGQPKPEPGSGSASDGYASDAFDSYSFPMDSSSMSKGDGGVSDEPVVWEVTAGDDMATYRIAVVRVDEEYLLPRGGGSPSDEVSHTSPEPSLTAEPVADLSDEARDIVEMCDKCEEVCGGLREEEDPELGNTTFTAIFSPANLVIASVASLGIAVFLAGCLWRHRLGCFKRAMHNARNRNRNADPAVIELDDKDSSKPLKDGGSRHGGGGFDAVRGIRQRLEGDVAEQEASSRRPVLVLGEHENEPSQSRSRLVAPVSKTGGDRDAGADTDTDDEYKRAVIVSIDPPKSDPDMHRPRSRSRRSRSNRLFGRKSNASSKSPSKPRRKKSSNSNDLTTPMVAPMFVDFGATPTPMRPPEEAPTAEGMCFRRDERTVEGAFEPTPSQAPPTQPSPSQEQRQLERLDLLGPAINPLHPLYDMFAAVQQGTLPMGSMQLDMPSQQMPRLRDSDNLTLDLFAQPGGGRGHAGRGGNAYGRYELMRGAPAAEADSADAAEGTDADAEGAHEKLLPPIEKGDLLICPYCPKSFQRCRRGNLTVHMRLHTGERRFSCHICNKRFQRKSTLQSHVRLHSNVRPFKCSIDNCGMEFTQHTQLRRHLQRHTGQKPWPCSLPGCDKKFSDKRNLKKHVIRVHADRKEELLKELETRPPLKSLPKPKFERIKDPETGQIIYRPMLAKAPAPTTSASSSSSSSEPGSESTSLSSTEESKSPGPVEADARSASSSSSIGLGVRRSSPSASPPRGGSRSPGRESPAGAPAHSSPATKPAIFLASSTGEAIPIVQAALEPSSHHQSQIPAPSRSVSSSSSSSSSRSSSSSVSRSPSLRPPPPPLPSLSPTYQQLPPPAPPSMARSRMSLPPAVIPGVGIGLSSSRLSRVDVVRPPALAPLPLPLPLSPPPPASQFQSLACAKAAESFRSRGERSRLPDADWRCAAGTGLTLGESVGPRVGGLNVPPPPPPPAPIGGPRGSLSSALSAGLAASTSDPVFDPVIQPLPLPLPLPLPALSDNNPVKVEFDVNIGYNQQSYLSSTFERDQPPSSMSTLQMLPPVQRHEGGYSDAFSRMDEGYVTPLGDESRRMMNSRAPVIDREPGQQSPIASPSTEGLIEVDLAPAPAPVQNEGLTPLPPTSATNASPEGVPNTAAAACASGTHLEGMTMDGEAFLDPVKMMDETAELGTPFDDVSSADDLSSVSSRSLSRSPEREFSNIDKFFPIPKFLNVEIVPPKRQRPAHLIVHMGDRERDRPRKFSASASRRSAPKRNVPANVATAPLATNSDEMTRVSSCSSLSRMSNSVSISSQPDSYNDLSGYTPAQIQSNTGTTDPLASLAAADSGAADTLMTSASSHASASWNTRVSTHGAQPLPLPLPLDLSERRLSAASSRHPLEASMRDMSVLSPTSFLPQSSSTSSLREWAAASTPSLKFESDESAPISMFDHAAEETPFEALGADFP